MITFKINNNWIKIGRIFISINSRAINGIFYNSVDLVIFSTKQSKDIKLMNNGDVTRELNYFVVKYKKFFEGISNERIT